MRSSVPRALLARGDRREPDAPAYPPAMATKTRPMRQKAKGPVDPSLGMRIRELRLARGWTQAQLAGRDFTKAFISHVETGRTRTSMRAAVVLAERLGVRVSDLLRDTERSEAEIELQLVTADRELAIGQPSRALALADQGLRGASGIHRARLARVRGRALVAQGDLIAGALVLRQALRSLTQLGDSEARIRTTFDLADIHARLDEPGEALSLLLECERALTMGDVVDRTLELRTHSLLAGTYWRLGDYRSADLQGARASALTDDVVDESALDTLYATLVATRREQGDLEGALLWARRSLALHERNGRESEVVHTWNNLAWIYIERRQFERAESALAKAERLVQARGTSGGGNLRITRARLELARDNPTAARTLVGAVLQDPKSIPSLRAQALFIDARALASLRAPLAQVRRAFESALAAFTDQPPRKRARVHEAFAAELAQRGLHKDAYHQAQQAMALDKPTPMPAATTSARPLPLSTSSQLK